MSSWLAEARSGQAELLAPNKLLYREVFDGVKADLFFEYTKAAFSQDVVLRAALPDPVAFGLTGDRVRLEVVTEFLEAPTPVKDRVVVWEEKDPVRAAQMSESRLTDDRLDFGDYQMGPAKRSAWLTPSRNHPSGRRCPCSSVGR
jgi:hypothetical protein